MAYMSQERKATILPVVKEILKRYGVKGTLSVDSHRTLVLNIREGSIDFIGNFNATCGSDLYQIDRGFVPAKDHVSVNVYHYSKHFGGVAKRFLDEVYAAMMVGNYNNSDIQSDYFDIGWYVDINIGRWNKPYTLDDDRIAA